MGWRSVRSLAVAGGAVAVLLGSATGAGAQVGPVHLSGQVLCDNETGEQVVSWSLHNATGFPVDIGTATVDGSGMSTPGPIDTSATFSPNPLALDALAFASTRVTGDGTGDYHLIVAYTAGQTPGSVDGEVVLPGGCQGPATTTTTTTTASTTTSTSTTASTTTTAPATTAPATTTTSPEVVAAAPVVTVTPTFTG